jgi:hypothetical protein
LDLKKLCITVLLISGVLSHAAAEKDTAAADVSGTARGAEYNRERQDPHWDNQIPIFEPRIAPYALEGVSSVQIVANPFLIAQDRISGEPEEKE